MSIFQDNFIYVLQIVSVRKKMLIAPAASVGVQGCKQLASLDFQETAIDRVESEA